jgi:hypothetical protein
MATAQNYLDKWLEYKNKAADKQLEAEEFVSAYTQDEAKNALKEANRASSISYQQAINPYGYLAEQRRMRGLSSSGITGRQNTNQYTGYQQALGSNSANYIGQVGQAKQNMLKATYQNEAQKLSNQADYYNLSYEEYIRQLKEKYSK